MADDYYVKQCVLEKKIPTGISKRTTWIDEKYAKVGKKVVLKDEDDPETWTVACVYDSRQHVSYMRDRERDHLRTRIASDI